VKKKALLGIAEERGGRRGGGNAFANTGLAAIAAAAAVATPYRRPRSWRLSRPWRRAGGHGASEIGKAWGGKTYLPTTLSAVRAGHAGRVSLEGSAAGILGALGLAGCGALLGLFRAGRSGRWWPAPSPGR